MGVIISQISTAIGSIDLAAAAEFNAAQRSRRRRAGACPSSMPPPCTAPPTTKGSARRSSLAAAGLLRSSAMLRSPLRAAAWSRSRPRRACWARMKALMNLPSTCGRNRVDVDALSGEKGPRIFDAVDAGRLDVDLFESRRRQAWRDTRSSSSAPAMQPTQSSMLRRISAGTSPRMTTSETANRPPGLSTRKASRKTRSLSAERLMTQLEMITSTELSGSGMFSISPFRNSTFSTPALRLILPARASISSVMSRP